MKTELFKKNDADRVGASIGVVFMWHVFVPACNVEANKVEAQGSWLRKSNWTPMHARVHRSRIVGMSPIYLIDVCTGLLRLGIATRFRMRSSYWQWRMQTAFGTDRREWPGLLRRIKLTLDYAAWTSRMRRLH